MSAIRTPEVRPQSAAPTRTPLVILIEALRWASGLGLTVVPSVAGHGVRCDTIRGRKDWRRPKFGKVSPQGALLLMANPQTEAIDDALCQELGCGLALLEGLGVGLLGLEAPDHWTGHQDEAELSKGWDWGRNARISLLAARPRTTAHLVEA